MADQPAQPKRSAFSGLGSWAVQAATAYGQSQMAQVDPGGTMAADRTANQEIDRKLQEAGIRVAEGGLDRFGTRLSMASANTPEERLKAFQQGYPEGQLVRMEQDGVLRELFQPAPGEDYRLTDPPSPELGDLADLIGGFGPEALGTAAVAALSRGNPGLTSTLPRLFAAEATGITAARSAEELAQYGAGFGEQGPAEVIGDSVIDSALAGLGFAAPAAINAGRRLIDFGRGAGVVRRTHQDDVNQAAIDRMRATLDPDAPPLTLGQRASGSPLAAQVERQVGALSENAQAQFGAQSRFLDAAGDRAMLVAEPTPGTPSLNELSAARADQIAQPARAPFDGVTPRQAGDAAQTGTREALQARRSTARDAYAALDTHLEQNPGVTFDLSPVLERVAKIEQEVLAETPPGGAVNVAGAPTGVVMDVIQKIKALTTGVPGRLVDETGKPLTPASTVADAVPFDKIKALRSQLFDITDTELGQGSPQSRFAEQLVDAFGDTMYGGDPTVSALARDAAQKWKAFIQPARQPTVRGVLGSDNDFSLGQQMTREGGLTNDLMTLLREQPDSLPALQKRAQASLLEPTANGSYVARVEKFLRMDPEAAQVLVPNPQALMASAKALDSLAAQPAVQAMTRAMDEGDLLRDMMREQSPARLQQALQFYGAKGPQAVERMRYGVILSTIRGAASRTGPKVDTPTLDGESLTRSIEEMKRSGFWDNVLQPEDRTRLEGLRAYAAQTQGPAGSGAPLVVASESAKVRRVEDPVGVAGTLARVAGGNRLFAKIFADPPDWLIGRADLDPLGPMSIEAAGKTAQGLSLLARVFGEPATDADSPIIKPNQPAAQLRPSGAPAKASAFSGKGAWADGAVPLQTPPGSP